MSRITRWKLEKTKVKVVFRLQFHATHIPSSGWEKLFISFVPTESGKTTGKTTKANVRNGTCKWADPIYETTRLLLDTKTKQYDEKLYKLVVSMGSSRTSILGEATINLADYVDALKPSAVSLPLHGCNSGAILHVTVQLLTSKTGFREFEQQRELRERGLHMGTNPNKHDEFNKDRVSSSEATATNQMSKVNTNASPESNEFSSHEEGLNLEGADSAVGFEGSSNTSESLYAEKHDCSSTHDIDSLKSTVSGDLNGPSHCPSLDLEKRDSSDNQFFPQGKNDCVQRWGSDYSVDNDLTTAYEENNKLRGILEVAESSVYELKMEVSSLQSYADELGGETQRLASQLAAEIASSGELAQEILLLKSGCSKFKDDLEQLKKDKLISPFANKELSFFDQDNLLREKQLTWMKGLSIVEEKVRELQKKAFLGFDERDFSFLHSDLEVLSSVVKDIKHRTGAIPLLNMIPSKRVDADDIKNMSLLKREQFVSGTEFDFELYQPESMLQYGSLPGLVSQESESRDATAIEVKNYELLEKLDEAKVEKENLARKMDQMECYYESLVQELEENQKQMLGELQSLRNEHSISLYAISTNKAEMESIRQNMNEQNLRFAEERHDMESLNKELERRVVTLEAALKRARLNYSIAVDQLQKDLELLSCQVVSMFETNENFIKQAFPETLQPCSQGYSDIMQNFEKSDVAKFSRCSNQSPGTEKQLLGGDILVGDMKKSLRMQQDLYQKVEEELCEIQSTNLYLDVLSKALQETLFQANTDIMLMKEEIDEITHHLELTTRSKDFLTASLQTAMDEIHSLNEFKSISISRSSEMLLQNQSLEAKLVSISMENCLLKEKTMECELLMEEYKSYQGKYTTCFTEKSELENLLKLEEIKNCNLGSEVFSLKEELKSISAGCSEFAVMNENLQKTINFLQDKLLSLLASYDEHFSGQSLLSTSRQDLELKDFMDIIIQLEQAQESACRTIIELVEEKKDLQGKRHEDNISLGAIRSEILGVKQKFKHDIEDMEAKLDVSNTLVGKLQLKLDSAAHKFDSNTEFEERYAQQNEELFADLALVEFQLQELASRHKDFGQEMLGLGTIAEELERSKITIFELKQEKQNLTTSLQAKTEESLKLASDLDSLRNSFRCLQDDLHVEKCFRDKLEGTAAELESSKIVITELVQEKQDLTMLLEAKSEESVKLASDLESSKITIADVSQEKHNLIMLLEAKTKESAKLESDIDCLRDNLRCLQDDLHVQKCFRANLEGAVAELESSKMTIIELKQEKQDLAMLLEAKTEESIKLASDLDSLKESWKCLQDELLFEKGFRDKLAITITDLQISEMTIAELIKEKKDLTTLLEDKNEESFKLASHLDSLKESLRRLQEEFHVEKGFRDKLEDAVTEVGRSKITISELIQEKQRLMTLIEAETYKSLKLESDIEGLNKLMRCLEDKTCAEERVSHELEVTVAELERSKMIIADLMQEKQDLRMSLQGIAEKSVKPTSDFDTIKESSRCLKDELNAEKDFRTEITSQLQKEQNKLLHLDGQSVEPEHSRQLASDHDIEKSGVLCLSLQHVYSQEKPSKEASHLTGLESDLSEMHEKLLAAEVTLTFVHIQYETFIKKLIMQLKFSDEHHIELQQKHLDLEAMLNISLANEAQISDGNAKLSKTIDFLRSDLEASVTENTVMSELNNALMAQLEDYKRRLLMLEGRLSQDFNLHKQHEEMLENACEEIGDLISSKVELEIILIVLRAKFSEQHLHITLAEEDFKESMKLQNQVDELTRKLSEQILRTEEFKNLSVHLKELKDKTEAECLLAHEKREPEGPSFAMQESLRIAFIKEQYETRMQELRQQLSYSKKHGEEMLWKLQDIVDENEDLKKSEASYLKRNEELSINVLELEAKLQSAVSDKRDKNNAYDRVRTELDCALLSLECCREEKQKLEASLHKCEEEKSKILVGLTLRREHQENSVNSVDIQRDITGDMIREISGDLSNGKSNHRYLMESIPSLEGTTVDVSGSIATANLSTEKTDHNNLVNSKGVRDTSSYLIREAENQTLPNNLQPNQVHVSKGIQGIPEHVVLNQPSLSFGSLNNVVIHDNFQAESLKSSMDHLHEELERMKNENSHFPQANYDPYGEDLEQERMHLHTANQELGSLFPLFNNFSRSGNALERVLALEIELAEALRAKKKSSFHIQSSFLKQHGDEEAVLKSFRDINELIKDMLELKARYASVETELKEMHDRYSDLSLQFAEVEGEREKLRMTLKNIRTSKKLVQLTPPPSDALSDHPL